MVRGEIHAVHSDHLNTPRLMTNAQNQPAWQWAYSAFGDNEPSVAARNFRDRSWAFANGELNDLADGSDDADNGPQFGRKMVKLNLRYPGQYFDDESNLHYNYRRTYDARTGRYTQPDPIGLAGGWNQFGFVEGNPLSFTDPEGLRSPGMRPQPRLPTPIQPQLPGMPAPSPGPQPVPSWYQPSTSGYTGRMEAGGHFADGFGAATGGGITGHHPSVPNAVETLIDPMRSEPFVPGMRGGCTLITTPAPSGMCPAEPTTRLVCGPVIGPPR